MWNLILLVLTILSIIWTWRLINFGIKTATRIAVATETTTTAMTMLCEALSPEAKRRIAETQNLRERETTKPQRQRVDTAACF